MHRNALFWKSLQLLVTRRNVRLGSFCGRGPKVVRFESPAPVVNYSSSSGNNMAPVVNNKPSPRGAQEEQEDEMDMQDLDDGDNNMPFISVLLPFS